MSKPILISDLETIHSGTTSGQATPARMSSSGYIEGTGTTTPGGTLYADSVGTHTNAQTYADIALPCPLPEDVATLKFELTRAAANNEILQSNVETLKSLALQLAMQLEEANLTISTLEEQVSIATMRNEVEMNNMKTDIQNKCESRLADLTKALAAAEETTRQTIAMWEDREAAAERRLALLEREKDRMISSLTNEIEVLRMGLQDQRWRDRTQQQASRQSQVLSSSSSPRRGEIASSDRASPSSRRSAANHKIAVLEVTVPSHVLDQLRYGDDEQVPWLLQQQQLQNRSHHRNSLFDDGKPIKGPHPFQVDVTADPSIADLTPLLPRAGSGAVGVDDNVTKKQGWAVRLVSGETILVSAEVL
jgi:hypothetical protein